MNENVLYPHYNYFVYSVSNVQTKQWLESFFNLRLTLCHIVSNMKYSWFKPEEYEMFSKLRLDFHVQACYTRFLIASCTHVIRVLVQLQNSNSNSLNSDCLINMYTSSKVSSHFFSLSISLPLSVSFCLLCWMEFEQQKKKYIRINLAIIKLLISVMSCHVEFVIDFSQQI